MGVETRDELPPWKATIVGDAVAVVTPPSRPTPDPGLPASSLADSPDPAAECDDCPHGHEGVCVECGGVPAVARFGRHLFRLRHCSEACALANPGEPDDLDALRERLLGSPAVAVGGRDYVAEVKAVGKAEPVHPMLYNAIRQGLEDWYDATVVRFDAELLVHRTERPLGCNGAVIVTTHLTGWNGGDHGSVREVVRCVLRHGHKGEHQALYDDGSYPTGTTATACGLPVTDGAWIDWTPGADDPRCGACHGIADDEQEALL